MCRKRGLGHIEAILSFVLFIGFLIFAFFFFSPFDSNRTLDTSLIYVISEVEDNASVMLESYSIVIDPSVMDSVVEFQIENPNSYRVRAERDDGVQLDAKYVGGSVTVDRISQNERFINVMFSEVFSEIDPGDGVPLLANEYTISSSAEQEILSEERFLELNNSYYSDYSALKKEFNTPRIDFGFALGFDEGGGIIADREVPEGIDVTASEKRVEIIRNSGEIVFADLTVKVW